MTEQAETRNKHAEQVTKLADAMLRTALWPAVGIVVIGAVVGLVWIGTAGLFGALVGGAVAFASSLATLFMMRKSAAMDPMAVMAVALGGYVFKMLVIFGVMTLLRGVDALHTLSLAITMMAVILVWAGAEMVAFKRTKVPTIIP
ncbi:hypothetical protein DI005_25080 [Prauserella sp. PE36]|uniref:ATP synthase protein I n=1 Tax=Prauserella endophytica TaxID=1592324 RepID=A0ABY2RYU4_9PSEU|nr:MULTISPECIES: hypothetical protein [Prauserella]RBM16565.1 hypothetical protein DI005_25080 [Prauserella sp. PE36]TKG66159.1 hypothetical protein FCN18_25290 [Prauserella endophytica]